MINLEQHGYTHKQVLDLLSAPDGLRNVTYRVDAVRQGVRIKPIAYTNFTYNCNYNAQIKYTGILTAKDDPMINWRTDFFRPVFMLHANGLDFIYALPPLKGVTVSDEIRQGVASKRIEAYDESVMLQENSLGDSLVIPIGTSYTNAIESIISRTGFINLNIEPSNKTVTSNREDWTIDASILTVSNELLGEMNYRSLEMGRDGILSAYQYREPSIADAQIHYKADNKSVILNDKQIERDGYNKPNRFIGHVFNADMTSPMRYEFLNDSPASPTSPINNGGYIITSTRQYDNVADYNTLIGNVQRWASETEQSYEYVNMTTAIMPHHEVREIIIVSAQGVNDVYTETAWNFDNFAFGGKMSHELRRIVYG